MAGLKFFTVALMLALCISCTMAQGLGNIPPETLAAISAACGAATMTLATPGAACYAASASGKPMKKCPPSCATLIKAVPNKACASAIFSATPAANRGKVAKACKAQLAAIKR